MRSYLAGAAKPLARQLLVWLALGLVTALPWASQAAPERLPGTVLAWLLPWIGAWAVGAMASLWMGRHPPPPRTEGWMDRHPIRSSALVAVATGVALFVLGGDAKVDIVTIGLAVFVGIFAGAVWFRASTKSVR